MKNKTSVTKGNIKHRQWHLIDLSGQTLGRISTKIAALLMGKDQVAFSFHRDDGGYVVAINAKEIQVTGRKLRQKHYYKYSDFPGGLKDFTLEELLDRDPREVIMRSVGGMLPKNKLRDLRLSRLKVFVGSEHPYAEKFKQK